MALYRQYRPNSFDLVVGQEAAVEALRGSLEKGKLGHASLLSGPHGIGKTTLARLVAQCLTCTQAPTSNPCGQCQSCQAFAAGNHPDLLEMDAASNRGVDDARAIRERLTITPMLSENTVLIIDEAHMLTREAQNALLKTLEEPPPGVFFIFATTAPDKLLSTIRSRCQHYMLRPPTGSDLQSALERVVAAEKIDSDPEALQAICSAAAGSYRDALSLLDQAAAGGGKITAEGVRRASGLPGLEAWERMCLAIARGDAASAMKVIQELSSQGFDLRAALSDLERFLRIVLYTQAGALPDSLGASESEQAAARQVAQEMGADPLWQLIEGVESAYQTAAFGGSAALAVEASVAKAAAWESGGRPQPKSEQPAPKPSPEPETDPEPEPTPDPDPEPETAPDPEPDPEPAPEPEAGTKAERPQEAGIASEDNAQPLELPGPAVAAAAFPLLKLALRTHYPEQYLALRNAWGRYDDKRMMVQVDKPLDKASTEQALAVLRRMVDGSVRIASRERSPEKSKKGCRGPSKVKPADDRGSLLASMGLTPLEGERRSEQEGAG